MAGPTPVSALIHAATMVTAGVYLVLRLNPLFAAVPGVLFVLGVVGALTALIGASSALLQRDIKKVLAYSTVSQLGYMFLGLAAGAWSAALFHLVTHAFFKGLLFLGSGSVIHGMHEEQDMYKMGGLRKAMPRTFATFVAGAAALSGLPLLSGFFSKDEILARNFALGGFHVLLWGVGVATAALTAFYMFRLVFLTFFGEYRGSQAQHRFSAMLAAEGVEGPDPNEHGAHGEHSAEHGEHEEHGPGDAHGHEHGGHEHGHGHAQHVPAPKAQHVVHAEEHGDHAGHAEHVPHESPLVMTLALAILAIVIANAALGFMQEERAERALASLKRMTAATALVVRDGERTSVPAVSAPAVGTSSGSEDSAPMLCASCAAVPGSKMTMLATRPKAPGTGAVAR